jgi:hypothetical protein
MPDRSHFMSGMLRVTGRMQNYDNHPLETSMGRGEHLPAILLVIMYLKG